MQREEDLMQNPFMRELRSNFESLYRRAAERGEATTIIVPCAECLEGEVTQYFAEAHVLLASHVPGCYMNHLGQGVEIKDSTISTHLGFSESRQCEVLLSESMYDYSNTFRVLVTDKPLMGRYKIIPGLADRAAPKASPAGSPRAPPTAGADGQDWLNSAPAIQGDFFDQVDRFRKTFVQVPGCEQSTAERIREIVGDAKKRLMRHHKISMPNQQRQLDYQVSRSAYAALYSFVFPHLVQILAPAEDRLKKAIRSYATTAELLAVLPGMQGRGMCNVDMRSCAEKLSDIDHKITPHEKITCIDEAHSLLQQSVADGARSGQAASGRAQEGAMEITGDDVLSLFILAVHRSDLPNRLAHIAHVEMYSQGEAARFEETGYAVSALQAALSFFLEERRHNAASSRTTAATGANAASRGGAARPTTNIFSSYLQPGADGYPASSGAYGAGEEDLQGLVRKARYG